MRTAYCSVSVPALQSAVISAQGMISRSFLVSSTSSTCGCATCTPRVEMASTTALSSSSWEWPRMMGPAPAL